MKQLKGGHFLKTMRLLRAVLLSAFVCFCLGACSSLFGVQALDEKLYQIPELKLSADATYKRQNGIRVSVRPAISSQLINSQKILFTSDGVEQGFYQFASWAEPPPKRVTSLLLQALEDSHIFDAVLFASTSAAADYQIVTELVECVHDIKESPGVARVRIRVEMINLSSRELAGQKTFSKEVPVQSYDARGAVDAMTAAMHELVKEILDWSSSLSL